jgi:MFS family permease
MYDAATTAIHRRQGWVLVAGLFAVLTVSSGFGFYNLSLYMNVLAAQRAFSVADVSGAIGVFFLAGGLSGLVVGRWLQHGDARLVMMAGAVLGGASLALMGLAETRVQLLLLYASFGIGNTAVSLIPATTLVTRWFEPRRRAMALSIASTGLSLGGVLLTPLSVALLQSVPFAQAMMMLGAAYAAGIVVVAAGIRSFPAGYARPRVGEALLSGVELAAARRTRFFIVLTASYVVLMGAQVGSIAHLYNRGVEVTGPYEASIAVALLASMSIVSRLLGGWLLARLPMLGFTLANIAGQALGLALLAFTTTEVSLWIAAAVFGSTVGNLLMLQPLLLGYAFGARDYPRIFALSQGITTLGIAAAPVLMGIMQALGGYRLAFGVVAMASCGALLLLATAGRIPDGERT